MPMSEADLEELKSLLGVAKKRPLNFGLCMGKKPEDTVFLLHRMKGAEILGRQAKKDGDTPKVAFGVIEVKGKKALLTCEGDVPAGIAKATKKFLTGNKMALKITVLDATGNLADDDGDDEEPDDVADPTGPDIEEPVAEVADTEQDIDPQAAAWARIDAQLASRVARAATEGLVADPSKLRAAWAYAVESAGEGDFAGAAKVAARVKAALDAATAPSSPTPAEPPRQAETDPNDETAKRLSSLAPDLRKLQTLDPEIFADLGPEIAQMRKLIAEGRAEEAQDLADEIEQRMAQAMPPTLVGLQKLRLRWQDQKKAVETQLTALRQALLAEFQDAEAQEAASRLDLVLTRFNDGLSDRLDDMLNATPGEARNKKKAEALAIAGEYGLYVMASPLISLVDDNPYLPVNVRVSLLQPLQLLEIELAKAGA